MNDALLLPHLLSRPHICLLRFFLREMCWGRRGNPGVYYTYPVEPDLTACVRGFPEGKAVVSQWLERGLMNGNLVTTCQPAVGLGRGLLFTLGGGIFESGIKRQPWVDQLSLSFPFYKWSRKRPQSLWSGVACAVDCRRGYWKRNLHLRILNIHLQTSHHRHALP